MVDLHPIQYHDAEYPAYIKPTIHEVAGHFDIAELKIHGEQYSLHTEYSYGKRKLNTELVQKYYSITKSTKDGVPMLWYSKQWAEDFTNFIIELCSDHAQPDIIEIHPPFSDYATIESFLEHFSYFEQMIRSQYPNVRLLIENRYGSIYHGGQFIVSTIEQISRLSNLLDSKETSLKITLDLPQLLAAHGFTNEKLELMDYLFSEIRKIRHNILGIHLWGKRKNDKGTRVAHSGDLNSFFYDDDVVKAMFLAKMIDTFDDNIVRYFVPEVNSGSKDLLSIVSDLKNEGFRFI